VSKADAIRKIKALRARALRGGSASECSTAAAKAFELMEKHGVTEDDLREKASSGSAESATQARREQPRQQGAGTSNPPQPINGFVDELLGQVREEFSGAIRDGFAGFREEFGDGMRRMGRAAGGRR
jgi:hypothetical protein